MEYARRIPHPRSGIPAWHWEPKDVRPEEGEYEENQQRRIDLLESKILLFEREREAFIRHLREGNIQLLKDYLGIKDE